MNFKTNLNRKWAFWFMILSAFGIAVLKEDLGIINAYLTFSAAIIALVTGSKANDTILKSKVKITEEEGG